jgi:hypothetical protein
MMCENGMIWLLSTGTISYRAGTILTIDETLVFWTGMGVHLTYLPWKPTSVGVMLKTICDVSSRVFLGWEFCEVKEFDSQETLG